MDEFTAALLRAMQAAQEECGVRQKRLAQAVQEYGGTAAAKNCLEELIVSAKYNALFTDDEVNACFALLCGADYYGKKL